MAIDTRNTDILAASLGRPIVLAFGRHLVGGNVILQDESDAANTVIFVALGEGIWDGIDSLNVNGVDLNLATSGIYHFHKGLDGEFSAGSTLDPEGVGSPYNFSTDGDQKADLFTPATVQGLTFSRTAYIALKIPFDPGAPSGAVSFQGVFRCRKVSIRNSVGTETSFAFSDNPAWQIADLLVSVRGLATSRIDWQSFIDAAAYCNATIDVYGDASAFPRRFVSNIAFTQDVDFDQALEAILATCRGSLADYGGKIYLQIEQAADPVFDFTMANIADGSFSAQFIDTRERPNRLVLQYRDPDNSYQIVAQPWNHEAQQAKTGGIVPAQLALGNLPQHQAERLGDYMLLRAINNSLYVKLRSSQASLAVMPGDVVRVSHDAAPWGPQGGSARWESFKVLDVADNADETRDFSLQVYDADTYPDLAGPSQELYTTDLHRSLSAGGTAVPVAAAVPIEWNIEGTIEPGDFLDLAVRLFADRSFSALQFKNLTGPDDQNMVIEVVVNDGTSDSVYASATIPAGSAESAVVDLSALAAIAAGSTVRPRVLAAPYGTVTTKAEILYGRMV